jgi:2-desacetyl-2-hydroxyethyl bacteriochlorophyllide A dehydrogenase
MKALICTAPGALVLTDVAAPVSPPPGWVRLDVSHVGICGTDFHIYEGSHPFLAYPRIMGHEVSGVVGACGEGVSLQPGTRVILNPYLSCGTCGACRKGKENCCTAIAVLGVHRNGAMCDSLLVPEANIYPAGDLPMEQAAAVEMLAIGAHAVRRSGANAGTALVIGAGPIGLGTALFARIAGQSVTLFDRDLDRLAMVRDLGFATLGSPAGVAEATDGNGFDLVYDATGNAASMQAAFAHVAHGGVMVLVSVVKDVIAFSDPEFHKREMTLIGSRNALRQDFDHVIASLRGGLIPMDRIITHRTTLAGAVNDLPKWAGDKKGLVKAVIRIG